ncbi:1-acyl-sn-glycerol-3-phosphate acyltransferase [Alicyclobacillus cellulosilyticus]|uniref:1-acyl-sn-glycerol-3-phosphate acyltransferase n=1 Tax=Alicyclobacillus cellulosilyticus TaxID=1003997 RepID=A0A917NN41_9BACL|nr:lysophospholipid acyltransferase family protein [Alicyclobacillus cellulosilyticus]GGJ10274.1 1-acyl-sn-glycerol-3-phosphate acyltransferase [Alicyclobacillus cellulosilyticus]
MAELHDPRRDGFYRFCRVVVVSYFRLAYRWRVVGAENIPEEGPVILASNHIHNLDPPLIGCCTTRFVHFLAKVELFRWRPLVRLLTYLGGIPVRRGGNDKQAIRRCIEVTAAGGCLCIFPEGHRSRTGRLLPAMPGVVHIARRANCPIVPIAIIGPYRFRGPLTVRIGEPITARPDDTNEALLERLMQRIQALLDEGHADRPSERASGSGSG